MKAHHFHQNQGVYIFSNVTKVCHPEAHLLREGSPGMPQPEMHLLGSSADDAESPVEEPHRRQIKSHTFREVLRAKHALQDDIYKGFAVVNNL